MHLAPILIFVYNRPKHTKTMLDTLMNCLLIKKSKVYFFVDGPKKQEDKENIKKVIRILNKFKKEHKKTTIKISKKNLGTYLNIIDGITKTFEKHKKIIVLEDDLKLKKNYLLFMNQALNKYSNKKRILQISGYAYPIKTKNKDTYFLNLTSCWGWGTWNDRWLKFSKFLNSEKKISKVYNQLNSNKDMQYRFNIYNSYNYFNFLKKQINSNFNSWGVLYYLYSFKNKSLNLFPALSLVENIGFDGTGLHKSRSNIYNLHVKKKKIEYILSSKIYNNKENMVKVSNFLKRELSLFNKIKNIFIK